MTCPSCSAAMTSGFLYVRGMGSALFWSETGDTGVLSRRGLEQIDLGLLSRTGIGAQAVLEASRCPGCKTVVFRSEV